MQEPPGSPAAAAPGPILLRSLSSAVLTDGSGDVALARESRGAVDDWGGVYAQHVRLTGPWRIFLWDGSQGYRLRDGLVAGAKRSDRWESDHRLGRFVIRQEFGPLEGVPGAVRRLRCSLAEGPAARLTVVSSFQPYLLPTMVEGIRPTSYRLATARDELRVRQRGFALTLRSSVAPCHLYLNRASWLGGRWTGRADRVATEHEVDLAPGASSEISWVVAGGLEREIDRCEPALASLLADPGAALGATERADAEWVAATPTLSFPDAPDLERGYVAARAALRRLFSSPGDGLTGLVAGYPWYSAIWCRDLAWMLPALLWLGDFDWFSRSLDSVFRFQCQRRIPLLGGEPGELPMQLSPGPVFLYGTSDTTLYYPGLVGRWLRHTGAPSIADPWRTALRAIGEWGLARSDRTTGLLRNGGEAEAISAATGALARVRYGIDSPDTTIWDSADRRDHAIDVQVLWGDAIRSILAVEPPGGTGDLRDRLAAAGERLAATLPAAYDWPAERYLYDSLRGGTPVAKLRPNALRAVSAGLVDLARARAIVRRASEADLRTPWGIRTLSARDAGYRPDAYHDGQVWTIATAWAADAAFAAGEPELGAEYLATIAERYAAEGEGANECYRGDSALPFDSCFLLGLSVGPFLSVLFERLWGLSVDARGPRLEVRPAFPAAWRSAALDGLRIGAGRAALRYDAPRLTVSWTGPGSLELRLAEATVSLGAGETATVRSPPGVPRA